MELKDYCLIILGWVDGVKDEISKISGTAVRYIDAKGIVIATFSTVASTLELREFFTSSNRSFVLFEMGDDNYGVNLVNKALQAHLFKNIQSRENEIFVSPFTRLKSEVDGQVKEYQPITGNSQNNVVKSKKNEFSGIDVSNLSITQREELVNKILDKGVENLSEQDKRLLKKISKISKK